MWVYALNAAIGWWKRRCMSVSMWLEHFFSACILFRSYIRYIWIWITQSERLENIATLNPWIPIKSWNLYSHILCVLIVIFIKKKNSPENHWHCFSVLLETCTVFTFVLGVTDHELLRVSQLSWSFYITSSTTGFTLLFLFILLHTTLYCKYLFCLSVVLCVAYVSLPLPVLL